MLNVLLSFAQYEREITSERIRDKFKVSCQLVGYTAKDHELHINEKEAKIVKQIYQCFMGY